VSKPVKMESHLDDSMTPQMIMMGHWRTARESGRSTYPGQMLSQPLRNLNLKGRLKRRLSIYNKILKFNFSFDKK